MNAFKEKIETILKNSGLPKNELIQKLGYTKPEKAKRRYDDLLNNLNDPAGLVKRLDCILPGNEIEKTYNTESKKRIAAQEQKRRKEFFPYLSVLTELRRPRNITIFNLCGGVERFLVVELPGYIYKLTETEQMEVVRSTLIKHYAWQNKETFHHMGNITGYVYHDTYDTRIHLNVNGESLEPVPYTRDSRKINCAMHVL